MYLGLIHFSLISSFINSVSFYVNNGLNCMKQDKVDKGRSILIQIYLKGASVAVQFTPCNSVQAKGVPMNWEIWGK